MTRTRDFVGALRDGLADRAPIDVTADLALAVDGEPVRVESYTDLVTVDLRSVRSAVRLLRRHRDRASDLPGLLAAAGLTVELTIGGTAVARAGADADASPLGRRLGFRSVRLRPLGCLLAAVRSPR